MHGSVNLTRAAELLTESGDRVTRSTLSRYVKSHADALMPTIAGGQTFVDFEALAAHRRENIRLDLSEAKPPKPAASLDSSRADEAAMNIRAQRLLRNLDIAERVKLVVPRVEVEDAARDAVSAMRNALALASSDTASAIATAIGCEDRLVRPHLRAFERRALENFIRNLTDRQLLREGSLGDPE